MIKYAFFIACAFSPLATGSDLGCDHANSTDQINARAARKLKTAETKMQDYLNKSIERYSDDPIVVKSINEAQKAWSRYQESHCNSVYTVWREGTIRSAMALGCKINLTQRRTHELWSEYLSPMDGSDPVLPEPKIEFAE